MKIPSPQPLSREAGEGLKRSADDGLHTLLLQIVGLHASPSPAGRERGLGGEGLSP